MNVTKAILVNFVSRSQYFAVRLILALTTVSVKCLI